MIKAVSNLFGLSIFNNLLLVFAVIYVRVVTEHKPSWIKPNCVKNLRDQ